MSLSDIAGLKTNMTLSMCLPWTGTRGVAAIVAGGGAIPR